MSTSDISDEVLRYLHGSFDQHPLKIDGTPHIEGDLVVFRNAEGRVTASVLKEVYDDILKSTEMRAT